MIKYCKVCNKEYKGRNKYTCSMACCYIYKTQKKKCSVCGKEFNSPKCRNKITCSSECLKIYRQQMHKDGVYNGTLEKAHEIAKHHPLTGHFETNISAKNWKIQSPSGEIFECRNLKFWLENHVDMLDGTVNQAWDGITKIKYSMQGKRKFKSYQWKGWRLIEWSD